MSKFQTYHSGLADFVGERLRSTEKHYLVELAVIAQLAKRCKVPKEHREKIRLVFQSQIKEADWRLNPNQDGYRTAMEACREVIEAMNAQDRENT